MSSILTDRPRPPACHSNTSTQRCRLPLAQSARGMEKAKPRRRRRAGSLHKNPSAAAVNKSGFPWVHRHLPSFPMNEPELRAHTKPLCLAKQTNEGGVRPNLPAACGVHGSDGNPLEGEMATCLQGWTGSNSSSHTLPGGHRGNKPSTLIPRPDQGVWGASETAPSLPSTGFAPKGHLCIGMNTHGGIYRFTRQQLYPSKPASPGSWNFSLPRHKGQFPAQLPGLSLARSLPAFTRSHVPV